MKRLFCSLLATALLLCGCAAAPAPTAGSDPTRNTEASQNPPPQENQDPTQGSQNPSDLPVNPDPVILYYNPLTGEQIDAPMTARPFAVMLNNSTGAMPQHGIADADIIYEMLIEGETRCMGIYTDIDATETFGSVRSTRKYHVSLCQSYDAILVHAGDSREAYNYMNDIDWDHIDGVGGAGADQYFYRNQDRLNDGYRYEHCLFIKPSAIREYAQKMGCTFTREQEISYGFQFDDESVTVGTAANELTVWFNMSGKPSAQWHKSTTLTYNLETGLYEAYQHKQDYVDGNNDQTVSFRNVLVLRSETWVLDDDGHLAMTLTGSGTGYFVCNGQLVNIQWSRETDNAPFVYTLEDGSPVTFGVGTSYIAIVPTNATVEWN